MVKYRVYLMRDAWWYEVFEVNSKENSGKPMSVLFCRRCESKEEAEKVGWLAMKHVRRQRYEAYLKRYGVSLES